MLKTKETRYIIAGPARSGTTITHLAIMGHPNVSALNDELNALPFFAKGFSVFTSGAERDEERQEGLSRLFNALTSVYSNEYTLARGIKTTIQSLEAADRFVEALKTNLTDVKIILTIRNDLVAQFASLKLAHKKGRFHSWVKPKNTFEGKIHINTNEFILYVHDHLKIINKLRSLRDSNDILEFYYEENILPNKKEYFQSLFDFLNIPKVEIEWLNSKKVSPPPEEYIKSYDYFCSLMKQIERYEKEGYSRKEIYNTFKKKSLLNTIKKSHRKLKKILCKLINC